MTLDRRAHRRGAADGAYAGTRHPSAIDRATSLEPPMNDHAAATRSNGHRIFTMTVASVYPLYLAKIERKGRARDELDTVIRWLTGYDEVELERHLATGSTFADFFAAARLNDNAAQITGVVCGVRVEAIEDPLMQQIRYLDKLVDELAKGRALEKVLRS
jgi:hypothetical protein